MGGPAGKPERGREAGARRGSGRRAVFLPREFGPDSPGMQAGCVCDHERHLKAGRRQTCVQGRTVRQRTRAAGAESTSGRPRDPHLPAPSPSPPPPTRRGKRTPPASFGPHLAGGRAGTGARGGAGPGVGGAGRGGARRRRGGPTVRPGAAAPPGQQRPQSGPPSPPLRAMAPRARRRRPLPALLALCALLGRLQVRRAAPATAPRAPGPAPDAFAGAGEGRGAAAARRPETWTEPQVLRIWGRRGRRAGGAAGWTVEGGNGRVEGNWGAERGVAGPQHPDTGASESPT